MADRQNRLPRFNSGRGLHHVYPVCVCKRKRDESRFQIDLSSEYTRTKQYLFNKIFQMKFVYILESKLDKSWYIGKTSNIKRRLSEHNSGKSTFTKTKMPWKIIYIECYVNKKDADGREKYLKSGAGRIRVKEQLKNYLSQIS